MIFKDKDEKAITALLKELDSLVRVNEPQARALLEKKLEEISNHDYRNDSRALDTKSSYLYKTIFTFLQEDNYNNKDLIGKLLKETPNESLTISNNLYYEALKDLKFLTMQTSNYSADIIERAKINESAAKNYKDVRKIFIEIEELKKELLNIGNNPRNISHLLDNNIAIYDNKNKKSESSTFLARMIAPKVVEGLYENYMISIQNSIKLINESIKGDKALSKEDVEELRYKVLEKIDVFGATLNDYIKIGNDSSNEVKEISNNLQNNQDVNENLQNLKSLLNTKGREVESFKNALSEWNDTKYNEIIKTKTMPYDTFFGQLSKETYNPEVDRLEIDKTNLYTEARTKNVIHFTDRLNEILYDSKIKMNRHSVDFLDGEMANALKLEFLDKKSPFKTNELDIEIQKERNNITKIISNKLDTYGVFNLKDMTKNQENREMILLNENDDSDGLDKMIKMRLKEMHRGVYHKTLQSLSGWEISGAITSINRDLLNFRDYENYNKVMILSLDNQMEVFENYKKSLAIINPLEANNLEKLFQESIKDNEQAKNMYKQKLVILNSKLNTPLKDGESIEVNNEIAKTKDIIDKIDRNKVFFKSIDRTNLSIDKKEQGGGLSADTLEKRAWLEKNITSTDIASQILKINPKNEEDKKIISNIFSKESMKLLNLINSLNESVLELDRLGINNSESESLKSSFISLYKQFNEKVLIEIKDKYKIDILDKEMIQDKEDKIIEQNVEKEDKYNFREFI